jgi:lactate dehydrogenase-like 2-hydroxyacid dehydrogenase
MKLIYHNRKEAAYNPAGAEYVADLAQFLSRCDVLSIHLPLTERTRHYLGKKELLGLKKGAVLVNTARGAIIDEAALVEVLEAGHLWSVGLDVYEEEPKIHGGLVGREDAVLFPHIGTFTAETQKKMEVLVIDNVFSALTKGELLTVVPEQRGKEALIHEN